MEGNEVLKKYVLKDYFQTFTYVTRPNSCYHCKFCTDIWYDSQGVYMLHCDIKEANIKRGKLGKCKYFREEVKEDET